jgi:hypothetical protein
MVQSYTLVGKYTYNQSKTLTPLEGNFQQIKYLFIRQSKYEGRPPYLSVVLYGDAKPQFISSCYEPRTKNGLYHFEHKGLRYEIVNQGGGEVIICHYQNGGLRENANV